MISEKNISTQELPLVTVIAACYNQSKFIWESLESIKNQTYPNLQLIIWDDFSKDNSANVIESWIAQNEIDCIFLKHTENKGICKSLNEAFSYAKGKYLQMIALDDLLLPDKIERHVKILENSEENVALVFSDAYMINQDGELYYNRFIAFHKLYFLSFKKRNFYEDLKEVNFIPAMSVLGKTEIFRKIGGWDEDLPFEDYDMWLRLSRIYEFIFDEEPTVKYRLHQTNMHKDLIKNIKEPLFLIYCKHLDDPVILNKCSELLEQFYENSVKNLKPLSKIYFSKAKPTNLPLYFIKNNIPFPLYRLFKSFLVLFRSLFQLKDLVVKHG